MTGTPRLASALRLASLASLCLGVACVVALHRLRPELSPARHRLSEYALGPYGSVMTAAFASIGAGLVALAPVLWWRGSRRSRPVAALVAAALVAAGIGMVASGIWRTDPGRSGATTDAIHSQASAAATLLLIAAALTWSFAWPGPGSGRRLGPLPVLAAVATGLGALSPALHRSASTGVSQRLLWFALLAWLLGTAWQLRRPAAEGSAGPQLRPPPSPHDQPRSRHPQRPPAPPVPLASTAPPDPLARGRRRRRGPRRRGRRLQRGGSSRPRR